MNFDNKRYLMNIDDMAKVIIEQAEMLNEKHPERTIESCIYIITDMLRRYAQWLS